LDPIAIPALSSIDTTFSSRLFCRCVLCPPHTGGAASSSSGPERASVQPPTLSVVVGGAGASVDPTPIGSPPPVLLPAPAPRSGPTGQGAPAAPMPLHVHGHGGDPAPASPPQPLPGSGPGAHSHPSGFPSGLHAPSPRATLPLQQRLSPAGGVWCFHVEDSAPYASPNHRVSG
jgi:hypothetical protein